jgi:hypothetical protein
MIPLMKSLKAQMRWIMGTIIFAFLLSTFLMYDSGTRRGSSSEGMADYVVADVDGKRLMRSELDRIVRSYLEQVGGREVASADWPFIYQSALNQYALKQRITQEIKNRRIAVSDAEAEQAMKDYADQAFPTREAFYQFLDRSGRKVEDYKKEIAQEMAGQRLIQESIGAIAVSDDEAVAFYDNMKGFFFRQPGGFYVNMAHFSSQGDAEKIRALLLGGKPWGEATSGDAVLSLDLISATESPEFFSASAFDDYLAPLKSLDIGAVSRVFEVTSGDFVVGVKSDAVEEKTAPYEEVSADIRSLLERQKNQESVNAFYQALLSQARIVIRDKTLFPEENPEFLPVTAPESPASADAAPPVSEDSK